MIEMGSSPIPSLASILAMKLSVNTSYELFDDFGAMWLFVPRKLPQCEVSGDILRHTDIIRCVVWWERRGWIGGGATAGMDYVIHIS